MAKRNYESKLGKSVSEFKAEIPVQNEQEAKYNLKYISIDLIKENPKNEEIFNMDITSISNAIEQDEFRGAIEVYDLKDGTYEISSGHRRYRALKEKGEKYILCFIFDRPDNEREVTKRLLSSNMSARVLTPLDYARSIRLYMDEVLVSTTGTNVAGGKRLLAAQFFNMTESKVQRYLNILNLPIELQKYAENTDFPYMALNDAKECNEEQIQEIISELNKKDLDKIKKSEVTAIIKAIINKDTIDTTEKTNSTIPYEKEINSLRKKILRSQNPEEYIDKIQEFLNELREEI